MDRLDAMIVIGALSFLVLSVKGQGTIDFRTRSATPFIAAPVVDSRNGQMIEGVNWTAQLYYAQSVVSDAAILRGAAPATHFLTGAAAGYVVPVDIVLSDVGSNVNISVQMRAWNTVAGNTYEEAALSPMGVIGESNLFATTTGGGNRLPAELVGLVGFSVFPVPEPKPFTLLLAGLILITLHKCIFRFRRGQSR
jgi:hypothetical protein